LLVEGTPVCGARLAVAREGFGDLGVFADRGRFADLAIFGGARGWRNLCGRLL